MEGEACGRDAGLRILISAGPTHEYLDDVRFLGNPSTGSMGLAVAQAALERGHTPILVLGPSPLAGPPGTELVRVISAEQMRAELLGHLERADAVVMCAAVSDYRPTRRLPGKIKKGPQRLTLELVKNPDILQELGRMAAHRPLVGFALEAQEQREALASARGKLVAKGLDLVVLNGPGSFGGSDLEAVTLVSRDEAVALGCCSKRSLGERIVRFLEERIHERGGAGQDTSSRR